MGSGPSGLGLAQVNYVGKGGNLYESGYEYHGSALVVSKLLGATYLWDKVPDGQGKAEAFAVVGYSIIEPTGFNHEKQHHSLSNQNSVGISQVIPAFLPRFP